MIVEASFGQFKLGGNGPNSNKGIALQSSSFKVSIKKKSIKIIQSIR